MSVSIDNVFVKQFEADVHLAYQQMGTKLRSTVRSKSGVVGASTTFQKVGRGTASTKSRHGIVPVMNLNHEPVECMLADYYAGDWVDALDELKVNIDERRVVASAGAYALGRKTDELIVSAMSNATANVGDYSTGLTKDLILSAVEVLNTNDVPDDGRRFAVVGVRQWNELLSMDEFVSADYVGDALPLLNGASHANGWALHGFCIMACRADLIICDDVEVPNTSNPPQKREQMRERLRELDFILSPNGAMIFIGTPHTHDTIYRTADDD